MTITLEELGKLVEKIERPVIINKGATPLSLLGIAFIVLKLVGCINWSWWWVLAPFWIPVCLGLLMILALIAIIMRAAHNAEKSIEAEEEPVWKESKVKESKEEQEPKKPKRAKNGERKSNKKTQKTDVGGPKESKASDK